MLIPPNYNYPKILTNISLTLHNQNTIKFSENLILIKKIAIILIINFKNLNKYCILIPPNYNYPKILTNISLTLHNQNTIKFSENLILIKKISNYLKIVA